MKIHIYGGQLGFLEPLVDKLGKTHTATYEGSYVNPSMPDVDVVWFEWADNNVVKFTKENVDYLKNKNVIVRLHAVEAYTGWFININWEVVDNLIVVSEHIKEKVMPHIPDNVKIHVIPNGIDLDKWTFNQRSNGPNVAVVGHFQADKGALIVPHIMSIMSNCHFHIAGVVRLGPNTRTGEYFDYITTPMKDRITFYGHVKDIDKWYEECSINYLLCPSLAESFNVSIGEAMAKGIKPIINDFWGSRKLWMPDTIYSTVDKIPRILAGKYDSVAYRKWVEDRYDLNKVVKQITNIFN